MKIVIFLVTLIVGGTALAQSLATSPGKEMYDFGWPDWLKNLPHDQKMQVDPQGSELSLTYWGEAPTDLEVQRVEVNVLSTMDSHQFAIEGNIRYTKVAPGGYLEMRCYFAPEKKGDPPIAYVTRTLANGGLMAKLDGSAGDFNTKDYNAMFRRFQIPFDITGAKTHLHRVIFKLHLAGGYGTTLQFDSVKFVQYPNGYFSSSVASVKTLTPTPAAPEASASGEAAGSPINANTATVLEGQLMTYLLWWPGLVESRNKSPTTILKASDTSPASWLSISHTDDTPLDLNQLDAGFLSPSSSFSNIIPTPRRYGLTGEIDYEDVAQGSYLEMRSYFGAANNPILGKSYNTRSAIDGSSSGRLFSLPLDSTKIPGELTGLSFNIHLAGRGKMTLKEVKMVRYNDPLPPSLTPTDSPIIGTLAPPGTIPQPQPSVTSAAPTLPGTESAAPATVPPSAATDPVSPDPTQLTAAFMEAQENMAKLKGQLSRYAPEHPKAIELESQIQQQQVLIDAMQANFTLQESKSLDWRSFLLGIASTCLSLLAGGGIIFASRQWNRCRHERELRRIAALDS